MQKKEERERERGQNGQKTLVVEMSDLEVRGEEKK